MNGWKQKRTKRKKKEAKAKWLVGYLLTGNHPSYKKEASSSSSSGSEGDGFPFSTIGLLSLSLHHHTSSPYSYSSDVEEHAKEHSHMHLEQEMRSFQPTNQISPPPPLPSSSSFYWIHSGPFLVGSSPSPVLVEVAVSDGYACECVGMDVMVDRRTQKGGTAIVLSGNQPTCCSTDRFRLPLNADFLNINSKKPISYQALSLRKSNLDYFQQCS